MISGQYGGIVNLQHQSVFSMPTSTDIGPAHTGDKGNTHGKESERANKIAEAIHSSAGRHGVQVAVSIQARLCPAVALFLESTLGRTHR
jgi:hypothetical protein